MDFNPRFRNSGAFTSQKDDLYRIVEGDDDGNDDDGNDGDGNDGDDVDDANKLKEEIVL